MRRAALISVGLILGYVVGAALGALAIEVLSTNTHDKSLEMAMTSAFVTGPIGALCGAIAGAFRKLNSV